MSAVFVIEYVISRHLYVRVENVAAWNAYRVYDVVVDVCRRMRSNSALVSPTLATGSNTTSSPDVALATSIDESTAAVEVQPEVELSAADVDAPDSGVDVAA